MNDIHDIEETIKIIYQNNNNFYFILLLSFLIIILLFNFRKRKNKVYKQDYIDILHKKIDNLDLNNNINQILDEISFILKDYIEYKENISCRFLTTEEISKNLKDNELINLLKEIDYMKYSYVEVKLSEISIFINKIKFIFK